MKKTWLQTSLLLSATTGLLLAGCTSKEASLNPDTGSSKLKVVTTFYPMYEFSKQVAGDLAEVTALIPPGVEPHDWEPTAKDIASVKDADLFVYNGIVEGWAPKVLESAANSKRIVVEASQAVSLMEGAPEDEGGSEAGHDHESSMLDPHVWLAPALAQKEVAAIQKAFEQADPAHKEAYQRNADAYIKKLQQLDENFQTRLKAVKRKDFITQHAAFAYMAQAYGLTQVPIAGLSPEEEPSPEKMADVVKFAQAHNVRTIFFETLADPKIAATIAKEIGAKTAVLNPLEGLTEEEKAQGLDYIAIMTKNLEGVEQALND
ncbi:metal ABC transporter substrate-binding protein [Paenibacillus aestuarii]|uniref:Metal ABC transporter substrate-binding protein n=1 Tax=Paenibacillus aestuarii TaxID=516965 RepID=A0ABW0KEU6_9BACL|nr:metal ABC transporter substrate-binding protein [Paenibacillus aestuarii]